MRPLAQLMPLMFRVCACWRCVAHGVLIGGHPVRLRSGDRGRRGQPSGEIEEDGDSAMPLSSTQS